MLYIHLHLTYGVNITSDFFFITAGVFFIKTMVKLPLEVHYSPCPSGLVNILLPG